MNDAQMIEDDRRFKARLENMQHTADMINGEPVDLLADIDCTSWIEGELSSFHLELIESWAKDMNRFHGIGVLQARVSGYLFGFMMGCGYSKESCDELVFVSNIYRCRSN